METGEYHSKTGGCTMGGMLNWVRYDQRRDPETQILKWYGDQFANSNCSTNTRIDQGDAGKGAASDVEFMPNWKQAKSGLDTEPTSVASQTGVVGNTDFGE